MLPEDQYCRRWPITHPSHAVIKITAKHIRDRASRYFSGRMIDIGCGTKAKGLLVREFVEEHIGLDHEECPHDQSNIDVYGTAYDIPTADESFDCQCCTAVLEHLEEPKKALLEAYRVLKPGGYGLYTVPLIYVLHEEPRDFFRYTKYGLGHMFETIGFQVIEITPLSGFWVTFATALNHYLQRFKRGFIKYPVNGLVVLANLIAPTMDSGFLRDERFTWGYLVVVRKPEHGA